MFKPVIRSNKSSNLGTNRLIINFNKNQLGNTYIKPEQVEEDLQIVTAEEAEISGALFEIY